MGLIKILDRYIVSKFLKSFFFTALLFSLIAVIIDFSERIDAFIKESVSVEQAILDYYVNFIAFINGMLWPLFALISVIYFTSRLAKNSEFISILNAGVGFHRILIPYMGAATFIALLHFMGNHYLIPLGNKTRIPFENTYVFKKGDPTRTRHIHLMLDPSQKLYIRNYRIRDSTALNLRIEKYNGSQLVEYIAASRASFEPDSPGWKLRDYTIRRFNGLSEDFEDGLGKEIKMDINLTPSDIERIHNQHLILTSGELREYIKALKSRGVGGTREFEIELYNRSAQPVSILILTLIGISVASRKVRGGLGINLAFGISLGALFIVISRFSMTFTSAESLGPLMGVWLPNVFFFIISMFLVRIAQN
jgi:lipopolysaccharide export system permease protein